MKAIIYDCICYNDGSYIITASWSLPLQLLSRRVALSSATTVLPNMLLARPLIRLELLHLRAVHVLHNLICLPFLEAEPQTFV